MRCKCLWNDDHLQRAQPFDRNVLALWDDRCAGVGPKRTVCSRLQATALQPKFEWVIFCFMTLWSTLPDEFYVLTVDLEGVVPPESVVAEFVR